MAKSGRTPEEPQPTVDATLASGWGSSASYVGLGGTGKTSASGDAQTSQLGSRGSGKLRAGSFKSLKAQRLVAKVMKSQKYLTHEAQNTSRKFGGGWASADNDVWGLFDVVGMKTWTRIWAVQSTTWNPDGSNTAINDRKRMIMYAYEQGHIPLEHMSAQVWGFYSVREGRRKIPRAVIFTLCDRAGVGYWDRQPEDFVFDKEDVS